MEDKIKTPKNAKKYECIKCNFICCKLCDYNRHLLTSKHNRIANDNEKAPKNATRQYICNCGKEYKYSSDDNTFVIAVKNINIVQGYQNIKKYAMVTKKTQ
jgi:hypothetical protein